jgi:hypothetical protein
MPILAATIFDRQRRRNRPLLASLSTLVGRTRRVRPAAQDERAPYALHP